MAKIVEVTNPVTGQPTQVDQLDHTAQQIDDGLNIARGVSNPNLLDNWYFRNPINQRQGRIVKPNTTYYSDNTLATAAGTTSAYVTAYRYATGTANGVNYASFKLEDTDTAPTYYAAPENVVRGYTGAGYGIDRFYTDDIYGTTLITDEGLVLVSGQNNRSQAQFFDFVAQDDTEVTLSALYKGDIQLDFWGMTREPEHADDWSVATFTYTIPAGTNLSNRLYCPTFKAHMGSTCTVKAAKLELGSTQTLAHQDENGNWQLNEIPDYGEQLARCQRYQRLYASVFSSGGVDSGNILWIPLEGLDNMRTTPSITDMDFSWLVCDGAELPRPSNVTVHGNAIGISNGANYPIHKVIAAYFTCFADANL